LPGARGGGEMESSWYNGHRVSVWEDEKNSGEEL